MLLTQARLMCHIYEKIASGILNDKSYDIFYHIRHLAEVFKRHVFLTNNGFYQVSKIHYSIGLNKYIGSMSGTTQYIAY